MSEPPLASSESTASAGEWHGSRTALLAVSSTALAISAGVLAPHALGKLFPYVNVAFTMGVVAVVLLAWRDPAAGARLPVYLGSVVTLSVAYRLRVVAFGGSMFGIDPDQFAIEAAKVVETGQLSVIRYDFYRAAPFHILEGVGAELIAGVPPGASTLVYALLVGVGLPLLAAAFVSQLRPAAPRTMVFTAGGVSLIGYTLRYSYAPIAQLSGMVCLVFGLFAAFMYVTSERRRWLLMIGLFTTGAVFTHKLAVVTLTVGVLGILLFSLVHPATRGSGMSRPALHVLVVTVALLVFQQWHLTRFGTVALFNLYLSLAEGATGPAQPFVPSAAVDPYTTSVRLYRLSYLIALAAVSGVAWLGWLWVTLRKRGPARDVVFVGAVAAIGAIIPLFYPTWVNPVRTVFHAEVLLVVASAVGIYWHGIERPGRSGSLTRTLVLVLMIAFLLITGLAPIASPDYEPLSRTYLTDEEVHAKSWGGEYATQAVGTDQYYAHETPPAWMAEIAARGRASNSAFVDISPVYLNRQFAEAGPPLVAHRHCVDTLRTSFGIWRLTYDPGPVLSAEYDRVYASGCVSYFERRPSTPADDQSAAVAATARSALRATPRTPLRPRQGPGAGA